MASFGVQAEVHGYLSVELRDVPLFADDPRVPTFDLHHQVLNTTANFRRRVFVEAQFEWEHAGEEFYIPLGQADLVFAEPLVLRAGYFVAPIGVFNEYQYPDFLRVTAQQPLFTRSVVPSLWSEVGVQLRGRASIGPGSSIGYAAFVSNGLEQRDPNPGDGVVPEGGDIGDMIRNARDVNHGDKALGGRLSVSPVAGVDVGVSGYTGAYTTDGGRRLSIFDADASYHRGPLYVWIEWALALQEVRGGALQKSGGAAMVAVELGSVVRPYVWYERIRLDGAPAEDKDGVLLGSALRPFPDDVPGLVWKLEAVAWVDGDASWSGQGYSQIAVAF